MRMMQQQMVEAQPATVTLPKTTGGVPRLKQDHARMGAECHIFPIPNQMEILKEL